MKEKIKSNRPKVGLALCVICPGTVPVKWMMHMMNVSKTLPGGLYWSFIYAMGDFAKDPTKNYATLRTDVIKQALELNSKYVLFIDSDVFIPMDAITKLMSHDVDIVNGVYWMKSEPPQPVIYKEIGNGPIWKIEPSDELLEIGGAGLGCCLIKTEVFEKFIENNIPLFKQDWVYEGNGRKVDVNIGEDHWFFHNAQKLGYKVWCDTNILCDHYDLNQDKFYPDKKVVEEISKKKIINEGGEEVLNKQIFEIEGFNKNNPSIVFFNANHVKFDGSSIEKKPISGSETAVIQMAKCMKDLSWNSFVFCNIDKPGYYDGVSYAHNAIIHDGMKKIMAETKGEIEVFVSSRDIRPFLSGRPPVKKTVLWMHDMPTESYSKLPDAMKNIDYIFFVSQFQANAYQEYFDNKIPKEKIVIVNNGLDDSRFIQSGNLSKQRGKCVYTTTPFRGLDVLLGVWPKIKARVPHAQLHVYSGMSIYNQEEHKETQRIFDLGKSMSEKYDVTLHEPVCQQELANVLMSADVMLYPNHYKETFCLVGDTKVAIPGGYKLLKDIKVGDVVYGYSEKRKQLAFGNVTKQWLTKRKAPVYKLNYRWGIGRNAKRKGYIIGTKNHQILMKDGTYKELGQLKFNESIMPFYRRNLGKYVSLNLNNGRLCDEHVFIGEELLDVKVKKGKFIIHHKDGNSQNNEISNLEPKTQAKHAREHINKLSKKDKKIRGSKISKALKTMLKDPKKRKIWSDAQKLRWKNMSKEERKNFLDIRKKGSTPEVTAKRVKGFLRSNERRRKVIKKDILIKKYLLEKKSMNQIAKELNTSDGTIKKNLKNYEIDIRGRSEAQLIMQNHKVENIEFYGYKDVYDIEVEGIHNFVANEIIVHNCITALESIRAKTPIVTSRLGALPETIKENEGILIDGDSYSEGYEDKFIEASVKLLIDDQYRLSFCQENRDMSWMKVAKYWEEIFIGKVTEIKVKKTKEGKVDVNTSSYWDTKHFRTEKEKKDYRHEECDEERYTMLSKLISHDSHVIDIGCADGKFLKYLYDHQIGQSLTGLDISDYAINKAKSLVPDASFMQISEQPCDIPGRNIDIITALHLVEHLEDPEKYINKWKKSLKPEGEMILIIPLNDNEYHEHLKVYTLNDIEELAKKVSKDYEIKTRTPGWSYPNGRLAREVVVRMWFD